MKALDPTLAAALEALDRGDTRRARQLVRQSEQAARKRKAERREARLFGRLARPKCGAPRADGKPCGMLGLWLPGEDTPRTRCRHHGGAQSPNVTRADERTGNRPAGAGEAPARPTVAEGTERAGRAEGVERAPTMDNEPPALARARASTGAKVRKGGP